MEKFAIVEIGSTNTKAYIYENGELKDLGFNTIEFKSHYKKKNRIDENDKKELFEFIKGLGIEKVYVYGTSIFRNLGDEEKSTWLNEFKSETGFDFNIVTSEEENDNISVGGLI